MAEKSNIGISEPGRFASRQPVVILSLEGGRIRTLYENAVTRYEEARAGRHTYADFDLLINDRTQELYSLLIGKMEALTRVGEMTGCHIVTPLLKVRIRLQLISACGNRSAYLAVGSDLIELGAANSDPDAQDYWRQVEELQSIDEVTGLGSVRSFQKDLTRLYEDLREGRCSFPEGWDIVCFDITRFSAYNQRFGFEAGNARLRSLGNVIRRELCSLAVTRYHSDRFYALVRDGGVEAAVQAVHAGIYTLAAEDRDINRTIDRAKLAGEYSGRDYSTCLARFTPEMERRLLRSNYLTAHLDQALERGWVQVYLQPVGNLYSRQVTGFEALARWDDPQYGISGPSPSISRAPTS